MDSLNKDLQKLFDKYNTTLIEIQESFLQEQNILIISTGYVLLSGVLESMLKDILGWLLQYLERYDYRDSIYFKRLTFIIDWEYGSKEIAVDSNWKSRFVELCKPSQKDRSVALRRLFILLPNTVKDKEFFEEVIAGILEKRNKAAHGALFSMGLRNPKTLAIYNLESLREDIQLFYELKQILSTACQQLLLEKF